jgi:hypothetical protein
MMKMEVALTKHFVWLTTIIFVQHMAQITASGEQAFVTYHNYYEGQSLGEVSCSDGDNGLMNTFGYDTIDPMSPYVAATSNVVWNSPNCGNCYAVTSEQNTVYVTAIDQCGSGPNNEMHFDMHPHAFHELLGDDGIAAGTAYVTFTEVASSHCQGNLKESSPTPDNDSNDNLVDDPVDDSVDDSGDDSYDEDKCCKENETRLKAYNDCTQFYHCVDGVVVPGVCGPQSGLLFDELLQNWNHEHLVTTCEVDSCDGDDEPSPSTPLPPTSITTGCPAIAQNELPSGIWAATDDHCAQCADGYQWWPCDLDIPLCECMTGNRRNLRRGLRSSS